MASTSDSATPACASVCSSSGIARRIWSRDASSGTTPPYSSCIATWEWSAWDSRPRCVSYNARPVSSQEDSKPRTIIEGAYVLGEGVIVKHGRTRGQTPVELAPLNPGSDPEKAKSGSDPCCGVSPLL